MKQAPGNLLSLEEIDELNRFLIGRYDRYEDEAEGDEGIIEISGLDGFLTAIVSGPTPVLPSEWIPALWGDFEPAYRAESQMHHIYDLIMRHMNGIATTLLDRPQAFAPLFNTEDQEGETVYIADEWCEGYVRGMGLDFAAWERGGEAVEKLLLPIMMFASVQGREGVAEDAHTTTVELQQAVVESTLAIHRFWRDQRVVAERAAQSTLPDETPKVGRNEPCPCGSGKKYKRCCLH